MEESGYWQQLIRRRTTRRVALRAGALGGMSMAAAYGLACSSSNNNKTASNNAVATVAGGGAKPAGTPSGAAQGSATAAVANAGEGNGKAGGTISFAFNANPPNYDLVTFQSYSISGFISLVYNGLLTFRNGTAQYPDSVDTTVVPDLVTAAPEQPDNKTYVFKLRPDVKWQNVAPMNGRQLVADDIKWFYDYATSDPKSLDKADFNVIDKIETPDQQTVKMTLKNPSANFLTLIVGGFNRYIEPKEVGEAGNLKTTLIGTGPFMLSSHEQNVRAVFKKNPAYWKKNQFGQQLPFVDEVDWLIIPDTGARLQAVQSRQANISWILIADEYDQLKSSNGNDYNFDDTPGASDYIYMRLDQPPFNDKRVRQAMSLAIDRPALIQAIGKGKGATDLPIPIYFKDYSLGVDQLGDLAKYYKRDIQAAKQLMSAAGHADGIKTTFNYTAVYGAAFVQAFQLVQSYLKEIGIDATARQVEYAPYLTSVFKGDFDGISYGPRGLFDDPDPFVGYFYTPGSIYYQDHSDDKDLQAMIAKERQELDKQARINIFYNIQKYLSDQMYRVYDVTVDRYWARAKNVMNYRASSWFPYSEFETTWFSK